MTGGAINFSAHSVEVLFIGRIHEIMDEWERLPMNQDSFRVPLQRRLQLYSPTGVMAALR